MPGGRDPDRGAEPDAIGMGGEMGQELERPRRDDHLEGVMLGRPDDVEPAFVRHLHHLGDVAGHLAHVLPGLHALHVDDEIEPHDLSPSPARIESTQ